MKDSESYTFDERMKHCWSIPDSVQDEIYKEIERNSVDFKEQEETKLRVEILEEQLGFARGLLRAIQYHCKQTTQEMECSRRSKVCESLIKSIRNEFSESMFEM